MRVAVVNGGGRRILPQELPRKEEGPPGPIAFLVNPPLLTSKLVASAAPRRFYLSYSDLMGSAAF